MAFKWFRRASRSNQDKSNAQPSDIQATAASTPLPADKSASLNAHRVESPVLPTPEQPQDPQPAVLSNDDEGFLSRVVSSAEEPRLPPIDDTSDGEEPSLAEAAAAEVARKTPLPSSPPPPSDKKSNRFSWASATQAFNRVPSLRRNSKYSSVVAPSKPINDRPVQGPPIHEEAQKEKRDLNNILGRLHLDSNSLQTRALSLSEDSRKLLNQFIQILKDIVSGAPHAYDDLDRFMKTREKQIEGLYESLPPFLQKLVQALPTKAWQYLGPQVAAGMAAATSSDKTKAQADARRKRQSGKYVPSLKSLLSNQGAVAAMLRSILEFLEARFPAALAGTNVLLSLAVFLLLFVFWYCYKRGKEERLVVEGEEASRGRSRENEETIEHGRGLAEEKGTEAEEFKVEGKPAS